MSLNEVQQGMAQSLNKPVQQTPQQQRQSAQRRKVLLTQSGVTPATPQKLSSGQKISQQMGNIGRNLWYGKQTGPESIAMTGGGVRLQQVPSTKQIMAETVTDIGIGLTLGGVTRVAMPAAEKATGVLRKVYKGSKIVGAGAVAVGTGAYGYQTYQQLQKGDTRSASIGALRFGSSLTAFGVGAGAFKRPFRDTELLAKLREASDINIHTGTPGSIRVGAKGVISGKDILNTKTTTQNGVEIFQHTEDILFKPGGKPELFLDTKISKPGGKIITIGGAEAQPRVIPGVKKPMRVDVLTGLEHRTGEIGGTIRSTRSFIYTKYEPEFKPFSYFEKTPLKFEKPLDVIKTARSIKPVSKPYTGKTVSSGAGTVVQFEKPLTNFERALLRSEMETPIFNVYPPGRTAPRGTMFTPSLYVQPSYDSQQQTGESQLGYQSESRMVFQGETQRQGEPQNIQYRQRSALNRRQTPNDLVTPIIIPGLRQDQRPDVIQRTTPGNRTTTRQTTTTRTTTTQPPINEFYMPFFPLGFPSGRGRRGGGGRRGLEQYRFRKARIGLPFGPDEKAIKIQEVRL